MGYLENPPGLKMRVYDLSRADLKTAFELDMIAWDARWLLFFRQVIPTSDFLVIFSSRTDLIFLQPMLHYAYFMSQYKNMGAKRSRLLRQNAGCMQRMIVGLFNHRSKK